MKKQQKFALSILTASLLTATSAMAAGTDSPFATPVHLTNPGETVHVTIKREDKLPLTHTWSESTPYTTIVPNIMLYLDDSGSMLDNGKADDLMATVPELVNQFGNNAYWGLTWLHGTKNNDEVSFTNTYKDVSDAIKKSKYGGGTPFLTGYVRAVNKFTEADLACDNNYVIAMTDGSANSDTYSELNSLIGSSYAWRKAQVNQYPKLTVAGHEFEPYQFGEDASAINTIEERVSPYYYGRYRYDYDYYVNTWGTSYYLYQNKIKSNSLYGLYSDQIDDLDAKFLKQLSDPLLNNANIKTYTVAYGMGTRSGDKRTKFMLKKGANGEGYYNGKKTYFEANNKEDLKQAFKEMFNDMTGGQGKKGQTTKGDTIKGNPQTQQGQGTSGTLSVGESRHAIAAPSITGEDKLFPQETVALWLPIWEEKGLRSAELRFYKHDYGSASVPNDIKLATDDYGSPNFNHSERRAYIGDGDIVSPMEQVKNRVVFGKTNSYFNLSGTHSDEWDEALLPWFARSKSDSDIIKLGYTDNVNYRNRQNKYFMGDILESDILTIGDRVDDDPTTGFQGRKKFVVAAANDGMAYIFRSNGAEKTDNARTPYNLMMTFAPSELQRQNSDDTLAKHYKEIADEKYALTPDKPHLYMLSGGITAHTMNKPFKIDYMAGNAGRGAKGLYAMNLSAIDQSSDWANDVPLFTTGAHKSKESKMGYTVGYPSSFRVGKNVVSKDSSGVVKRNLKKDIIVATAVGSGFSSKTDLASQETALYLYNTLGADVGIEGCGHDDTDNTKSTSCVGTKGKPGDLLGKASMGNTGGLATPALVDIDMDGVADYAFAGDYSGNMYRCDIRDYTTFDDKDCTQIFAGDKDHPITSAPQVAQLGSSRDGKGTEYVVTWGTGSDMFLGDVKENKRQALYGVYQAFDNANEVTEKYKNKVFTEKDLLEQSMETISGSWEKVDLQRKIDKDGKIAAKMYEGGERKYEGWKVDLDTNGERVVVQPMIVLRTVYFVTRVYGKTKGGSSTALDTSWKEEWTADEWRANGWTVQENTSQQNICSDNDEDKENGRKGWSAKVSIGKGDPVISPSANRCANTSTETEKFQSTCIDKNIIDLTAEKSVDGEIPKTYSALIQLNVATGGAVKRNSSSYLLLGKDRSTATEFGYTGGDDNSFISSEIFLGHTAFMINNPSLNGSSRNEHGGVSLRGGIDPDLDENASKWDTNNMRRDNNCAPDDGKHKFEAHGTGGENYYFFEGWAKVAQANCLRRISWREIY